MRISLKKFVKLKISDVEEIDIEIQEQAAAANNSPDDDGSDSGDGRFIRIKFEISHQRNLINFNAEIE